MRTEIPKMSDEEWQARAQAKKGTLLCFLASGEGIRECEVCAGFFRYSKTVCGAVET